MDLIHMGYWLSSTLVLATAVLFVAVGVFMTSKTQEAKSREKKALKNICMVFVAALVFLFLIPFIGQGYIIILSLVLVGITMITVIDLAIMTTKSLDEKT